MSRLIRLPATIPDKVKVVIENDMILVEGPLGKLQQKVLPQTEVIVEDATVKVKPTNLKDTMYAGSTMAFIKNMLKGVSEGFEKKLKLVGVGFRAQAQGDSLTLSVGYSHPIVHKMPTGINVETPSQTDITIKGNDKQKVSQVAADIRALRKPEPYKGKGIRYEDEMVIIKETKKKK